MSHRFTASASRPLVFLGAVGLIALAIIAAPTLTAALAPRWQPTRPNK